VIDVSTSIIDAHLLRKPVLSVAVWRTFPTTVKAGEFGLPTVLKNDSCALADISSFEKVFYQMMNEDEFRNKIIKNADKSIQKYVSFPYEGATTLLTFLEKFEKKL
jgi:hypothetical protein